MTQPQVPPAPAAWPAPTGRAGFGCALRSELTKVRTVRSTYWLLGVLAAVTAGIGALIALGVAHSLAGEKASDSAAQYAAQVANIDPVYVSLAGLILGQLIIVVFGALVITSEYSSGMVRATLIALPRRGVVYAAKAVVFGGVALVAGLITSFIAYFIGQAVLSAEQASVGLSHPHVLRAVIGGGLFLAVCGLLAFGVGALLRHSAGAIAVSACLLFVTFILWFFIPDSWQQSIGRWFPFNAGSEIWQTRQNFPHSASTWTGFAAFCVYAAVALIGGLIMFCGRDA
ncbi:MAG: ABC transporter permease subunit [Micromonosporaceae bacterium]